MINQPVSFSLDAFLLMEKICSTEVDETSTDRISQATGDNLQSTQHCNNQMASKGIAANITVITFKEVVNGYDPFSTIFPYAFTNGKGHLYTESLEKTIFYLVNL